MKTKIAATIRGQYQWPNMAEPKPFETVLNFTLIPPEAGEAHYGTGCYMLVESNGKEQGYIDVRYAGTKDIKKLAKMYIDDHYGNNAKKAIYE